MNNELKNYLCEMGFIFVGGCGEGMGRRTVDIYDPKQYPGLRLFITNTDLATLNLHFPGDDQQKRWEEANALTIHQLGGEEVTNGRGAGGKPDVGRAAARTKKSQTALRAFIKPLNKLAIVTGLGGGTGTGAAPVIAEIATKMGKNVIAIAVLPDPDEGRDERALEGLKELRSLVTTATISNAYLKEYLKSLPKEESALITDKEAFDIVDKHSCLPLIETCRAFFQSPGDLINTDESDIDTMLEHGELAGFGWVEAEDKEKALAGGPEKLVKELFMARFQDPSIFQNANIVALRREGGWPRMLAAEAKALVRAHVLQGSHPERKVEIHEGIASKSADGKLRMALFVIAGTRKVAAQASAALQPAIGDALQVETAPAPPVLVPIAFSKNDGKRVTVQVTQELATRFENLGRPGLPRRETQEVYEAIEKATGHRPGATRTLVAAISKNNDAPPSASVPMPKEEAPHHEEAQVQKAMTAPEVLTPPSSAPAPEEVGVLDEPPVQTSKASVSAYIPAFLRPRPPVAGLTGKPGGSNGNHPDAK